MNTANNPFKSEILNQVVEQAGVSENLVAMRELNCMRNDSTGNNRDLFSKIEEPLSGLLQSIPDASLEDQIRYQRTLVEALRMVSDRVKRILFACENKNLLHLITTPEELKNVAEVQWQYDKCLPPSLKIAYDKGQAYGADGAQRWLKVNGEEVTLTSQRKMIAGIIQASVRFTSEIESENDKLSSLQRNKEQRDSQVLDVVFESATVPETVSTIDQEPPGGFIEK